MKIPTPTAPLTRRLLTLSVILVFASCASPKLDESSMGTTLPEQERPTERTDGKLTATDKEFETIQNAHASGDSTQVIELAGKFEKKHPKSRLLPAIHNLKGLAFLQQKKTQFALINFKKAVLGVGQDRAKLPYYAFNLASAQLDLEMLEDAQRTLEKIEGDGLEARTRVKFHYLKSRIALRRQQYSAAANEVFLARQALNDPSIDSNWRETAEPLLARQLDRSLEKVQDISLLEAIARDNDSKPLGDIPLYWLGQAAKKVKNVGLAETSYRAIVLKYPESIHAGHANDELKNLNVDIPVDRNKIGVLLPMTGKFAKFGQQALHGVELAFDIYQSRRGSQNYRLVIEDAGETPEQAVAALDRLNYEHNVVAVIGPLVSKGIEQVSKRAQDIGLPLVALTQQRGIDGDFVFYAAVSPRNQTQELARYATERLGLKRFGIVAPANKFGEEFTQTFWDAIEERGGRITAMETYDPKETDFRATVDKMVGLFYPDARSKELEELAKYRKENNITKKTRMTEKYFSLPPVIEFDAVFIPDEAKVSSQIIPTFAYRDVDKVRFLGTAAWNSPRLIERAGDPIQGAIFVDSFFAMSPTSESQRFQKEFESVFSYPPTAIEALSYDAARMVEHALDRMKGSGGRSILREELTRIQEFPGATGRISFREGRLYHQLQVLTVDRKRIVLAP